MCSLFVGCKSTKYVHNGSAQGTTYSITAYSDQDIDFEKIQNEIQIEINRIDQELSNYRYDSTVERINREGADKTIQVSDEIKSLLLIAQEVHQKSDKCYDLTIRPLLSLWRESIKKSMIPSNLAIMNLMKSIGMGKISIHDNKMSKENSVVTIDLSSIAQGYTVKQLAMILEKHKIFDYLVEIGGEMLVRGKKSGEGAWTIGIENPLQSQAPRVIKELSFGDHFSHAVMTSGTYRNFVEINNKRFSHIIDPRVGKPVDHSTVSVTVIHEDAAYADAWSTALLCLGSVRGLEIANQYHLSAYFVDMMDDQSLLVNASEKFKKYYLP